MKAGYLEQNLSSFWELNDGPRTRTDSTMTKPLVRRSRQCQKPLQITLCTDFPNPVNIHVVITSPSIVHRLRHMWYHCILRNSSLFVSYLRLLFEPIYTLLFSLSDQ